MKKRKIEYIPICLLLKIKGKTLEPEALNFQDQCPKSVILSPTCEVFKFPEGSKHFSTFSGFNRKVIKLFPSKERWPSSLQMSFLVTLLCKSNAEGSIIGALQLVPKLTPGPVIQIHSLCPSLQAVPQRDLCACLPRQEEWPPRSPPQTPGNTHQTTSCLVLKPAARSLSSG